MYFSKLSKKDQQTILKCFHAILEGNFLEYEFETRLGISEKTLQEIIDDFPLIDDSNQTLAINNCLNEIIYGLNFSEKEWNRWFSVEREEIIETYQSWTKLRGLKRTGII